MRRLLAPSVLALCGFALLAASASADVVVRGPFGRVIVVVPSPTEVRVGPGVAVATPAKQSVIVSKSAPVVRPDTEPMVLPPPRVLPGGTTVPPAVGTQPQPIGAVPVLPKEFAKNFRPGPNPSTYEIVFEHPLSHKAVTVPFILPAGTPRVSCHGNNLLVIDYGRGHEVTIRFQAGNKVQVTTQH